MVDPVYLIAGGAVAAVLLMQLNARRASPRLSIVNRWILWLGSAAGGAFFITHYQWTERPFWVLALILALVWFLGETVYTWLVIHAMSVSSVPLFPKFALNSLGDEWPTHPRFLRIRDQLRAAGFRPVQALRAEVGPGVYLRLSVYQDVAQKTRAHVMFLPHAAGGIGVALSLSSQAESGQRWVTDNLYLPFGGFYPENWRVERNPWRRSWASLWARHQKRVASANEALVAWNQEPLVDVNAQQRELDRVNTEMGFLFPPAQREDLGKMSHEGRYRVWKEVWMLNYFGRTVRY